MCARPFVRRHRIYWRHDVGSKPGAIQKNAPGASRVQSVVDRRSGWDL